MNEHYTIFCGATPYHYILFFEPDLKTFKFKGQVIIQFNISKSIKSIKLNAKDLKIKSAKIRPTVQISETIGQEHLEQKCTFKLKDNDEVTFNFKKPIEGQADLIINYEGEHNDKLYGFYRSKYTYKDKNKTKTDYILSTQFEAPNARAAFPCLDEPEYKATFSVWMLIDNEFDSISNMPIDKTILLKNMKEADSTSYRFLPIGNKKNKKLIQFRSTPKMSTYLLYLGVGKYDRLKGDMREVSIEAIATKGKNKYLSLPLEYSKKLLADLENYFGIHYPLPKLDFIAIPDFAAGAMENWGAITFRETALLGNEKETTVSGKQRIAEVVAHEIAHMWFGDLVTMKWWDDMWLNESFATYMEYKSVDRVFPEWKTMLKYYIDSVGTAFVVDGLRNTHPISVNVNTAGEISELFDAIGYNKGGSVLLMLENFVGTEIFRSGLIKYLNRHSYANATKTDLWTAIEEECKLKGKYLPVIEVMEDWINREGYPVVSVKKSGESGIFEISQERFTISGNMEGLWKIPINYVCEKGEGQILLKDKNAKISAGSWIKLNSKQTGFFRVSYEPANLMELGQRIKDKKLGDLDAWGIENDLFAFVRSGQLNLETYLNFVEDYCIDSGYPANVNISDHLGWLHLVSYGTSFSKDVKALSNSFHKKLIDRLGWEVLPNESSIDTKLRSIAISELGMEGDLETIQKAEKIFEKIMKGEKVNPNLKRPIFYTIAFNKPTKELAAKLLKKYQGKDGTTSPEDKIIALQAFSMLGDKILMSKALELSLSKEIRLQDSVFVSSIIASVNPIGREIYKKWAMKNWKTFMKRFDQSSHMLKSYVSAFGMLTDKKSYEEIEAFFNKKSNQRDDIRIEIRQTLERIYANMRFIERNSSR